jgi:hypothetical protein
VKPGLKREMIGWASVLGLGVAKVRSFSEQIKFAKRASSDENHRYMGDVLTS